MDISKLSAGGANASYPSTNNSKSSHTGKHAALYKCKVNLIARVTSQIDFLRNVAFLQDLPFSLYRFGWETCGGEGGEIGNIKTKNGQYLFPVAAWTTN